MPDILLVTPRPARLAELASAMARRKGVILRWAGSGREALAAAASRPPHLAVLDEDLGETNAWDLLVELMAVSAFINTALVSSLPEDDFQRASEGMGVLAHLPPRPQGVDADLLLMRLGVLMKPGGQG